MNRFAILGDTLDEKSDCHEILKIAKDEEVFRLISKRASTPGFRIATNLALESGLITIEELRLVGFP